MDYEAVTSVRCGNKTYSPGQSIPDGVLGDRDVQALLELGSISIKGEAALEVEATSIPDRPPDNDTPPPPPTNILEYVNSVSEAGLERIKGVGKATAKAMKTHGTFTSLKELKELVPGVDWDAVQIE
jgi:hypothetical protein